MKIFELNSNKVRWAVGKNIDKATNPIRQDIQDPDNIVIWINIKDLFDKTDPQQKLDIEDITGGRHSIGNRVQFAKEHWREGGYMDPPLIHWNEYFQSFAFTDGRHRLVAAYQLGERYAPVIIDRESAIKLKELVKTR